MKIGFASDHRGFNLKKELINYFSKNYEIIDFGTNDEEPADYPDYAKKIGTAVSNKEIDYGVAICGSGIGISIACNKVKGAICAKVSNELEASYTRNDNNSNIVAFGENTPLEEAIKIVDTFINTPFSNLEKHINRINKIKEIENAR